MKNLKLGIGISLFVLSFSWLVFTYIHNVTNKVTENTNLITQEISYNKLDELYIHGVRYPKNDKTNVILYTLVTQWEHFYIQDVGTYEEIKQLKCKRYQEVSTIKDSIETLRKINCK